MPARALVISALALTIPIVDLVTGGGAPGRFDAVVWLSTLVPAFIVTHYRGWSAAALCLALGFFGLGAYQIYVIAVGQYLPGWPIMLAIVGAVLGVSLVLALVERSWAGEARSWDPFERDWAVLDSNR